MSDLVQGMGTVIVGMTAPASAPTDTSSVDASLIPAPDAGGGGGDVYLTP